MSTTVTSKGQVTIPIKSSRLSGVGFPGRPSTLRSPPKAK